MGNLSRHLHQACLLPVLLGAGPLQAQTAETGFLERTLKVEGRERRYQIYVPATYSPDKAWPVILFLHGAGERGEDGREQTAVGLGPAIRKDPSRFPAIVVFPQARQNTQWVGAEADLALAALDKTLAEYRGDANRIYLTGLSMGGHGTWHLAYREAKRFAAVAPICGWIKGRPGSPLGAPAVPFDQGTALPTLALRLAKTPVWIFHGDQDPLVPVGASREAAEALRAIGAPVQYTEYPGVGHNAWDAAYGSEAFVQWLFAQKRP